MDLSAAATSLSRTKGVTVTWTGGDANSTVDIHGTGTFGGGMGNLVAFDCLAPASAGQFTVPPAVLLAIPFTSSGSLRVSTIPTPAFLSLPGLDGALIVGTSSASIGVAWITN